jgi:hypothetical protein
MVRARSLRGESSSFAHPIGLLLFNRPDYARRTLEALAQQESPIDQSRLTIFRDGYVGSKDEHLERPDRTAEVDDLVAQFFPDATFVTSRENVGVARAYEHLYAAVFAADDEWAALFEEDFVVDSDYLSILSSFISLAEPHPQIVAVSAIGDVSNHRERGPHHLYVARHLWAYALRRRCWSEMKPHMDAYFDALGPGNYWQRDVRRVIRDLAQRGYLVQGTSQDFVKFSWMLTHGYLALNTGQAHGEYIGVEGLHSTQQSFDEQGFSQARKPRDTDFRFPQLNADFLDELRREARASWALWFTDARERAEERLATARKNGQDARENVVKLKQALRSSEEERLRLEGILKKRWWARFTQLSNLGFRKHPAPSAVPGGHAPEERGGWTWFGGTSALSIGNVHLVGFVRKRAAIGDGASFVGVYGEDGKHRRSVCVLPGLQLDDHNVPTLVPLNQREFLVGVTGHNQNSIVRLFRGTAHDGDVSLGPPSEVSFSGPTSYVHIMREDSTHVLVLTRVAGQNFVARRFSLATNSAVSAEMAVFPWSIEPGDEFASGRDGGRPYLITRESQDGVVFVLTQDHPRAYRNGIVAGRFRGNQILDLDGNVVHTLSEGGAPWKPFESLTKIVNAGSMDIPWVSDVVAREDGTVDVGYSTATLSAPDFHRGRDQANDSLAFHVIRWSPATGLEPVMYVPAGRSLYAAEEHYSGGLAINPRESSHVVYSTSLGHDARDDQSTRWSLYSRESLDMRVQTRLVETGSPTVSPLRPKFSSMAPGAQGHALFVMRGSYTSYVDFETRMVCYPFVSGQTCDDSGSTHIDLMYPVMPSAAMPAREVRTLGRLMSKAQSYVEFGGGGSTLMALSLVRGDVFTVESDAYLAQFLREAATKNETHSARFTCVVPRVDVIKGWGRPATLSDADRSRFGESYARAGADSCTPDLVLVDGRFRVACALLVAKSTTRRVTIAIDDYANRPGYHAVERFLGRPVLHGRLGVFRLAGAIDVPDSVLQEYFGVSD